MEIENVMFWISSIYIIPIWGLMWFAPRHEITKKIVGDLRIAVLPLCIPYAILAIPSLPDIFITLGAEIPTPEISGIPKIVVKSSYLPPPPTEPIFTSLFFTSIIHPV